MHRNNDEVQPGQSLFVLDPRQYSIALQERARRPRIGAQLGGRRRPAVDAAGPGLRRRASRHGGRGARLEKLHEEDPGAISVRRLEMAQATRTKRAATRSAPQRTYARHRSLPAPRATATRNCAVRRAAVEKAELDLSRTQVIAPARGIVTDLRIESGISLRPARR